jgi:periplasmic protein TonB
MLEIHGTGQSPPTCSAISIARIGQQIRNTGVEMKVTVRVGLLLGASAIALVAASNRAVAQRPAAPLSATPQTAPPAELIQWQNALATHLGRFKRYPNAARSRGEQGTATVAFTIDRDGRLLSSRIVQSSGSSLLDEETLAMLARAQPMPKPPITAPDGALSLAVPMRFDIR